MTDPPLNPTPPTEPNLSVDAHIRAANEQHLNLLGVFHYVLGGVTMLLSFCPSIYLVMGIMFLLEPQMWQQGNPPPPPGFATMFGLMFTIIPAAMMILGWVYSGLLIYAGRCLSARRRHTFCLVLAGISCAWVPLGTVLGVFTLIVLLRPGVKAMFEATRRVAV